MSAERQQQSQYSSSYSSGSPSVSDDSSAQKVASSSAVNSEDISKEGETFVRNRLCPVLNQTKEASFDTADEGKKDEELEGEESSGPAPKLSRRNGSAIFDRVIAAICVCSTIVLILGCLLSHKSETSANPLERYDQQMNRLLVGSYPKEDFKTRSILHLAGKKLISQEAMEPYVVLIVGEHANKFAADIVKVFSDLTDRGNADTILLSANKRKHELNEQIAQSLSKERKAVILDGIDKLRGDTPLSLHRVCDSEHSPHRSALILLTINRSIEGSNSQCETVVSSLLEDEWQSEYMNKDRIIPILSRITSFVICLKE